MAFGTKTVPKVDKILGPGNPYVSAAKRLVYGTVDIGLPAGPSESLILADAKATPEIVALDLLIEAEHGPDSAALLVTPSERLAKKVAALLPDLLKELPEQRREFCVEGFKRFGMAVVTETLDQAIEFVNDFAPEHLEVLTADPMKALKKISNAGEINLGEHTPITIGNFSLGPNAILPTGRFARTYSPVSVHDFLKRSSVARLTRKGYDSLADVSREFAEYEGFPAHAMAIRKRPKGK